MHTTATTTSTDTECGNKKSEVAEDLANFVSFVIYLLQFSLISTVYT